ncbi:DUF4160 domain-containing protein [Bradyrhizobium sp. SZCCHNR1075]|uniref:DUF4160 domain-containing protein n=1 Tax=Bradyrhizobium sp. SZCCHNR1075 TaxID=3057362 RepID=UPI0028EA9523|nr:DUF4160 domain-containing protein [Bradyrhizobium sp. SZCCHNR1075]
MGKLYQIGNAILRVYANDHLPPHFHIVSPDDQAIVEIETLNVLRGTLGSNGQAALRWASENIATIKAEWNRVNQRFPIA